jgi:acetyl-CoA C-acetyltransferase
MTIVEKAAGDAVICSPLRAPIGRFGGAFANTPPTVLAVQVLQAVLKNAGIDPDRIDDVILGQCYPNGEAPAIGRIVALDAGLPVTVGGAQVDRRCGSGLQAIINATMQVATNASDVVLAGGAESMSQVEYYAMGARANGGVAPGPLLDRLVRARITAGGEYYPVSGGMLETAENVRRRYSITREEQDALALESHRRAIQAWDDGLFADEVVPITVQRGDERAVVEMDESPRRGTNAEVLAGLTPVLIKSDPEATVTAGNASTQNDGASMCVVARRSVAEELGLQPMGRIVSWAVGGVEPKLMGLGPVPATARALGRIGLDIADMDLIELNEAFAAQVLGCTREWGFGRDDFARMNVHGSGISLGHPVGATGGRMMATLLHEMRRRDAEKALLTMCIGGGQGLAAVVVRDE